jgi:hypothetical protein
MTVYTRTDLVRDHLDANGVRYPLRVHTEPGPDGAVTVVRPRRGYSWGQGTAEHLRDVLRDLIGATSVRLADVTDRIFITWRTP